MPGAVGVRGAGQDCAGLGMTSREMYHVRAAGAGENPIGSGSAAASDTLLPIVYQNAVASVPICPGRDLKQLAEHTGGTSHKRIECGEAVARPRQPLGDGYSADEMFVSLRVLLKGGEKPSDIIGLPPTGGKFGKSPPTDRA